MASDLETQPSNFFSKGSEAKVYDTFDSMNLIPDNLLRGVYSFGFEKPS